MRSSRPARTILTQRLDESEIQGLPEHERLLIMAKGAIASHDSRERESAQACLRQAAVISPSPEHARKVQQLQLLSYYVMGFWAAVEDGLKLTENGELVVDGERMFIVDVSHSHVTVRRTGRTWIAPRNDLPAGLALAIADRWFDATAPSTKVFRGAFFAVSPVYGAPMARQEWSAASRQGLADEVRDLVALLDEGAGSRP